MSLYANYKQDLFSHLRGYQSGASLDASVFDKKHGEISGPPVFTKEAAGQNVLLNPSASHALNQAVADELPVPQRHRWFRSMSSSQTIAQSVFANLKHHGQLRLLEGLRDSDGGLLFPRADAEMGLRCELEHNAGNLLGERQPTSVDVWLEGEVTVGVECKLMETEVGPCSRPRLRREHANYCDGTLRRQGGRAHPCSLAARAQGPGATYWDYLPDLLGWEAVDDGSPCPLRATYQLVRTLLTVCVGDDRTLRLDHGHAVLVYDARNPAFWNPREECPDGGAGGQAFSAVSRALGPRRALLRRCSWQAIASALAASGEMNWLVAALDQKYGLVAQA